jgi:NTP pyrophosphatase (non-canonical NTP hydrolase)
MNLNDYQTAALQTQQVPVASGMEKMVPFLGLSGEVGELLNAYKKHLRDGEAHLRFTDQMCEELGDILWYVADVASRFDLTLEDIAQQNLEKVNARWGHRGQNGSQYMIPPRIFDAEFPEHERIPRKFTAHFEQHQADGNYSVKVYVKGKQMGQDLTDNAHEADGYRFHDVFHLSCAAVLGWSPVVRRNLDCKRRSNPKVDEVEDGGRAIVTEEGISALVFAYASDHAGLMDVQTVDYDLLKVIKILTRKFEVAVCTTGEWEYAILEGYRVWQQVGEHSGGILELDLDSRSISYHH